MAHQTMTTANPSPSELMSSAEDDRTRLCRLVEQHHGLVWRTLRRLGFADADADDAAQEVFLVVYRKLDRIDPSRERSFVYGVTVRVAQAQRRRRSRRREAPLEHEEVGPGAPVDEAVHRARRLAQLDQLLDQLPFELRTVFVLHAIEELSRTEVARTLGLPPGTVASRLRRARDLLRAAARRDGAATPTHDKP